MKNQLFGRLAMLMRYNCIRNILEERNIQNKSRQI